QNKRPKHDGKDGRDEGLEVTDASEVVVGVGHEDSDCQVDGHQQDPETRSASRPDVCHGSSFLANVALGLVPQRGGRKLSLISKNLSGRMTGGPKSDAKRWLGGARAGSPSFELGPRPPRPANELDIGSYLCRSTR